MAWTLRLPHRTKTRRSGTRDTSHHARQTQGTGSAPSSAQRSRLAPPTGIELWAQAKPMGAPDTGLCSDSLSGPGYDAYNIDEMAADWRAVSERNISLNELNLPQGDTLTVARAFAEPTKTNIQNA